MKRGSAFLEEVKRKRKKLKDGVYTWEFATEVLLNTTGVKPGDVVFLKKATTCGCRSERMREKGRIDSEQDVLMGVLLDHWLKDTTPSSDSEGATMVTEDTVTEEPKDSLSPEEEELCNLRAGDPAPATSGDYEFILSMDEFIRSLLQNDATFSCSECTGTMQIGIVTYPHRPLKMTDSDARIYAGHFILRELLRRKDYPYKILPSPTNPLKVPWPLSVYKDPMLYLPPAVRAMLINSPAGEGCPIGNKDGGVSWMIQTVPFPKLGLPFSSNLVKFTAMNELVVGEQLPGISWVSSSEMSKTEKDKPNKEKSQNDEKFPSIVGVLDEQQNVAIDSKEAANTRNDVQSNKDLTDPSPRPECGEGETTPQDNENNRQANTSDEEVPDIQTITEPGTKLYFFRPGVHAEPKKIIDRIVSTNFHPPTLISVKKK